MTADDIKRLLSLEPLEIEGGYFRETYRSAESVVASALPDRYGGARSFATAIYYLLTPDVCSRLHRLASDEVFHFYLGDPVKMLQIHPAGACEVLTLGHDVAGGQRLQVVVPRGVWQGCLLADGGKFALMGTTVAPGFDRADYESADRNSLIAAHPDVKELIERLT